MSMETLILYCVSFVSILAALHCNVEYLRHRDQVRKLQSQRRIDREAYDRGGFAPSIVGLWPDLDEKSRLRARVDALEAEKRGEKGQP